MYSYITLRVIFLVKLSLDQCTDVLWTKYLSVKTQEWKENSPRHIRTIHPPKFNLTIRMTSPYTPYLVYLTHISLLLTLTTHQFVVFSPYGLGWGPPLPFFLQAYTLPNTGSLTCTSEDLLIGISAQALNTTRCQYSVVLNNLLLKSASHQKTNICLCHNECK